MQDFYVYIVVICFLGVDFFVLFFHPSCFPITFTNRLLSSQKHFCLLSKTLLIAGTNAFGSNRNTSECTPLYHQSGSVIPSKHAPCVFKSAPFNLFCHQFPSLPCSFIPFSLLFLCPFPVFPTASTSSRRFRYSHSSHDSPFSCLFIFFPYKSLWLPYII